MLERMARLEERMRHTGGAPSGSRRTKVAIGVGALLLLAGAAVTMFVLGGVKGQTVMRSSSGQMVTVRFGTTVRDVHWFDAKGVEKAPLTFPDYLQPGGNPVQVTSTLIVPDEEVSREGPTSFVVRYRAFGIPRRATISFDANETDVETTKRLLAGIPQWVSFSSHDPPLLYFSALLVYKYALTSITWALDDGPLDRNVQFTPSNAVGIDRTDQVYVVLPPTSRSVRVKLRYKDGTESDVRTFTREHHTLR
jgi:hypothetical protein